MGVNGGICDWLLGGRGRKERRAWEKKETEGGEGNERGFGFLRA